MTSHSLVFSISKRFWPELEQMSSAGQLSITANIFSFLYSAPLAVAGLIWLIANTDLQAILNQAALLAWFGLLMIIAERLNFFLIIDVGKGRYAQTEGALDTMILLSGLLVFGSPALWLGVGMYLITLQRSFHQLPSKVDRWNSIRSFSLSMAIITLGGMLTLELHRYLGGQIPIAGLTIQAFIPALVAIIFFSLLTLLAWLGYFGYILVNREKYGQQTASDQLLRVIMLGVGLPSLATPFAILAAGIFVQNGLFFFIFFMVGVLAAAWLTRQLSSTAESNRQRSRQLETLERLGEAIINSPLDASRLPEILEELVPPMFAGRVLIWVYGDQILMRHPAEWEFDPLPLWAWLTTLDSALVILEKTPLPWDETTLASRPMAIAPIYDLESDQNIGAILVEMRAWVQEWNRTTMSATLPALQSLTSHIASALHQADIYQQTLEYQKMSQELSLAGRIQSSFLPNRMPNLPGWQLAVTLLPARATSGDFFDFIPLPDGRLGLLIADVADKGIGPALYMALSRTLIRTYATEYPGEPAAVLKAANLRILTDARASLFVTLFYGVLDTESGELTYVNAGHNPPYLFDSNDHGWAKELEKTGIPLGIDEETLWEEGTVTIQPGDVLVLYTDGVTEAQNAAGDFFNDDLLLEAAEHRLGQPAHEIQLSILEAVQSFVGENPQGDDITLMVLVRDPFNHAETDETPHDINAGAEE